MRGSTKTLPMCLENYGRTELIYRSERKIPTADSLAVAMYAAIAIASILACPGNASFTRAAICVLVAIDVSDANWHEADRWNDSSRYKALVIRFLA
jgi:hypothetical protein